MQPQNKKERLEFLKPNNILDSFSEGDHSDLTDLAAEICGTKKSIISILDRNRQLFEFWDGERVGEIPIENTFCKYALDTPDEVLIVENATQDERFNDNSMVIGDSGIVFYAGIPIVGDNKRPIGVLFVLDDKPKKLTKGQIQSLKIIRRQVENILALHKSHKRVSEQKKVVDQSITYAKRLQRAMMPTKEYLKSVWPNSFVFYKPKDLLSGDFYMVDHLPTVEGKINPHFFLGDCTGHGVPGSLLNAIFNSIITEVFSHLDTKSLGEALSFVREKLTKTFVKARDAMIHDGMDAAFCRLDLEKNKLYFAGANLDCIIVRGSDILRLRGDAQHIGFNENPINFNEQSIDVQKNDTIYLMTDGFRDQFGGENNKKYMRAKIQEFLIKHNDQPPHIMYDKLEKEFNCWKGDNEQVDDVTLVGIKVA